MNGQMGNWALCRILIFIYFPILQFLPVFFFFFDKDCSKGMKENRISPVSRSCLWFLHFVSVRASGEKGYPWKGDFIFSRQKLLNMYFLMCIWIFFPSALYLLRSLPSKQVTVCTCLCVSTYLYAFLYVMIDRGYA